jgi:hypothetical protein
MADLSKRYPAPVLFTYNKSATAAAVGEVIIPNVHGYHVAEAKFELITNGSETFELTGSNDGTNYSAALIPFDVATGKVAADSTLSEGKYLIPKTWSFSHYKFTGSSTVDVKTFAFAALILPK